MNRRAYNIESIERTLNLNNIITQKHNFTCILAKSGERLN